MLKKKEPVPVLKKALTDRVEAGGQLDPPGCAYRRDGRYAVNPKFIIILLAFWGYFLY